MLHQKNSCSAKLRLKAVKKWGVLSITIDINTVVVTLLGPPRMTIWIGCGRALRTAPHFARALRRVCLEVHDRYAVDHARLEVAFDRHVCDAVADLQYGQLWLFRQREGISTSVRVHHTPERPHAVRLGELLSRWRAMPRDARLFPNQVA
jgi:hypothetical protein